MSASKIIKYLLFTFNFIFFLAGIIVLTSSVYARNNQADYQITDEILPGVDLLIYVSAVTLIFGFLGSYGAITENRCLLGLFFLGLLKMFILLLAVAVLGAVSRTDEAQEAVEKHLKQFVPLIAQIEDIQRSFQDLERNGFCCGMFVGHLDWGNSTVVPSSCNCTDTTKNCTMLDGRAIYSTPCMVYMMTWMDRVSVSVMGAAFGLGGLMILGMVFSLVLICKTTYDKGSII
ncbi:tetraspanin-8-like [Notolabrus celidotus]|uniref:tetraspanin-8-like n=1 Tax=Notolabrus celidotus TaxID=1203425 RepID=UPI00148FFDF7|nr:tetraspanin-8-like [Notolabrus celidotus]